MGFYLDPSESLHKDQPENKFSYEFEYLYWFLNSGETLFSKKNYSEKYINYLQSKFSIDLNLKKLVDKKEHRNFWFYSRDELAKEINTKKYSWDFSKKHHFVDYQSRIFTSESELQAFKGQSNGQFVVKGNYGFSGKEVTTLENLQKKLSFPVIVEEKQERLMDFGIYVEGDNCIIYENLIDQSFQYKASCFQRSKLHDWKKFFSHFPIEKSEYERFEIAIETLKKHFKALNIESYNIDGFVYKQNTQVKINPMNEINYRRTMGLFFYKIFELYFQNFSEMTFEITKNPVIADGEIQLSPENSNFLVKCYASKD
ncbi:MAG: hypothetical protein H6621_05000 [Halobacteriovoraceae bacterium]|nr:hypothetical protein [Halobacteriovoraceae bacterium]